MRACAGCTMTTSCSWMLAARMSTFTGRILGWKRSGRMSLFGGSGTMFLGVLWDSGVVCGLPTYVKSSPVSTSAVTARQVFCLLGVSVRLVGVGAAPCSGTHFFRTRSAGACLVLGLSFGWPLARAFWSLIFSGFQEDILWS